MHIFRSYQNYQSEMNLLYKTLLIPNIFHFLYLYLFTNTYHY